MQLLNKNMKLKNLLLILFTILVLSLVFEGGFYFGTNYSKSKVLSDNLQNVSPSTTTSNQSGSLNACLTTLNNQSQPEIDLSKNLTPGVDFNFLKSYTQVLLTSNNEILKEASISYKLRGNIVTVKKNETYTFQGQTYKNKFLLVVEDPLTHVITAPYLIPYQDIGHIKIQKQKIPSTEVTAATIDDLLPGKLVEVQETGDLKNKKSLKSTITILD